jgi:hypothetical protein
MASFRRRLLSHDPGGSARAASVACIQQPCIRARDQRLICSSIIKPLEQSRSGGNAVDD